MTNRSTRSIALLLTSLWVAVPACDVDAELERVAKLEAQSAADVVVEGNAAREAEAKGAALEVEIEPTHFDLEAVAGLVEDGEIESAAELEVIVNDAEGGYNHLDIDGDGKIDHVQVVEIKGPRVEDGPEVAELDVEGDVVFALRVVPSSTHSEKSAVVFATVSFARHPVNSEVEIRTRYTEVVHAPKVRVYTQVVPVKIDAGVLVGGTVFLTWLYAVDRPVYVGVYEIDEHGYWIPPGHVKHGHWKSKGHHHRESDAKVVIEVDFGHSSKHHGGHGFEHDGHHSKGGKGKGGKGKGKGKHK